MPGIYLPPPAPDSSTSSWAQKRNAPLLDSSLIIPGNILFLKQFREIKPHHLPCNYKSFGEQYAGAGNIGIPSGPGNQERNGGPALSYLGHPCLILSVLPPSTGAAAVVGGAYPSPSAAAGRMRDRGKDEVVVCTVCIPSSSQHPSLPFPNGKVKTDK